MIVFKYYLKQTYLLSTEGGEDMAKKGMTDKAAARIQAHADSTNTNKGFKSRVMRAAAKKEK